MDKETITAADVGTLDLGTPKTFEELSAQSKVHWDNAEWEAAAKIAAQARELVAAEDPAARVVQNSDGTLSKT